MEPILTNFLKISRTTKAYTMFDNDMPINNLSKHFPDSVVFIFLNVVFENYYICTKSRTTSNDEQGLYPFKVRLKAAFKYILLQSSEIKCNLVHRLDKRTLKRSISHLL